MYYKRFNLILLSLVLSLSILINPIYAHCESVTPTQPVVNQFITDVVDFLDVTYEDFTQFVVKTWTIIDPRNSIFSYDLFKQWLNEREKDNLLDEEVIIHTHGGGGHSRVSDAIDDSTDIEVPQELKTEINLFIQNQIENNPVGYRACYIPSYSTMTATPYPTYKMYNAVKQYIKDHSGYSFFVTWEINYGNVSTCHVFTIPRDLDIGWVGTTTTAGTFTNVHPYINWQLLTSQNIDSFVTSKVRITANGDILSSNAGFSNNYSFSNSNTLNASGSPGSYMVYTSYNNRELVYVFETLNAYKNYNSGLPQPYYLTQTGMSGDYPINNGIINSGTLNQSSTYYNSVVDNSKTGMTPEEVMELIKLILDGKVGDGSGSGDDSDGSDFDLGFLGTIGRLIGSLITGLGNLITNILNGIVTAFMGEDGNGGILGIVKNILNSLTGLISSDFSDFITSIFSFMPEELNTVLIAGFTIAIFIGVLRLVRR